MKSENGAPIDDDPIAIVGIGCRFPGGADTPEQFWRLLRDGVDAITEMPRDRFNLDRLFDADPAKPGRMYVRWGGFVHDIDKFDAQFFGISPREASRIDVQHRMLLETTWAALEDAGLPPERLAGTDVGVYVGISTHDYGDIEMHPENRNLIDAHSNVGTATSIAANRISYHYDFRGPSFTVDTACSSALTALHCAVAAMRAGDCSIAVVAGVQALLAPELTIGFCKASMLSVDGRCKAFDASGNGYVRSEGAGVVVLKRLSAARADGDPVYAVIRGTAINQDGRTNGITVPRAESQADMLRRALMQAGVSPQDVQFVEAHGPGTAVGDPQEATALGDVFAAGRPADQPLLIGSVKTNIGHLEAGSGVAGLIKAALAIKHGEIPASLHFNTPNPTIDFEHNRLRVVTKLQAWPDTLGRPRTAGVNSFGFGGANAHVVLQSAPAPSSNGKQRNIAATGRQQLLVLSARSAESLRANASAYLDRLTTDDSLGLADVCYTAALRRAHHDHRVGIVASSREELLDGLDAYVGGDTRSSVVTGRTSSGKGKTAFVFSGMGPQWWGMGRQLMTSEPVFRQVIEECDRLLARYAGWSLLTELGRDEQTSIVSRADIAQVSNFAIQAGLAAVWAQWGIRPDAVIGHSAGEMAAAYVAGMLSLDDALLLAFHRGRLQHRASGQGRMLAVGATPEHVQPLLAGVEHLVSLAAVNSPTGITLAGDEATLSAIAAQLQEQGVFARMLPVLVPYHSPKMDPIRDELVTSLAPLAPRDGTIPMVSIVSGRLVEGRELDAEYWWRNVRQPVLFGPGVAELVRDGCTVFVEVAPHPVLSASVNECLTAAGVAGSVIPSLRRMEDERGAMLRALAGLYTLGRRPNWSAVLEPGHHAALPTYAFQRDRHWLEADGDPLEMSDVVPPARADDHPLLGRSLRTPRPTWESSLAGDTLEFLDDHLVQGALVYPGAAYTETALAAAAKRFANRAPTIRGLEFHAAMLMENRARSALQLVLDAATSRFEIFSAPLGSNGDTPWTLHASGTLAERPMEERPAADLGAVRARCTREVSQQDYYDTLRGRGLELGPAFQGIERLWQGDHEAIAFVKATERHVETERYQIHPALLDSAFQPLIGAALSNADVAAGRGVFLPIGVREIALFEKPARQFWSHARVVGVDMATRTVEGDVVVMNEDGGVLIEIKGLRCRLLEAAAAPVHDMLYDYSWEPSTGATLAAEPTVIAGGAGARVREAETRISELSERTGWSGYYEIAEPVLDRVAGAFACHALYELGWSAAIGQRVSVAELVQTLGIDDRARPLFRRVLEVAASTGLLAKADDHWHVLTALPALDAERVTADAITAHPEFRTELELLSHCGRHLAAILRATADAREVLFSRGALPLMERMYRDSATSSFHNALAAEAVAAVVRDARVDRAIRVLEVGAGTGGTTAHVLPLLDANAVSYTFSDVTPFFNERALASLPAFPNLTVGALDIERDPATQALGGERFDVILAANVLHATENLSTSLGHLETLLAPGGVLVLQEITRRPLWLDLVFGLTDGWWRFADRELRPDHALLSPDRWRSLLESRGFDDVTTLSDSVPDPAQSIIVARASASKTPTDIGVAAGHYLLLADAGDVATELASRLEARGATCTVLRHEHSITEVLSDTVNAHPDIRAVVYLRSLNAPGPDASAADIMGAQRAMYSTLLDLTRLIDARYGGLVRELWLVSRGSQRVAPEDDVPGVAQGTLWGFGRTVMRELDQLRCRLIELDSTPAALDGLTREMLGAEIEEEVAFRGARRYVRRMRPIAREHARRAHRARVPLATDAFRAEVDTPGALESVALRARAIPIPGPNEVVVRVKAAGLNFREIILAMGMLPSHAAVGTFGGEALGLDCAGVVEAVGENVTGVKIGDEVIAAAPASIASHVVTSPALVLPKPEGMSFADAAAIPVAWVTAYHGLHRLAHLQPGERVLIHAATGGVGLAAIHVARAAGAEVFATAGSEEKRAYLRALGIQHVMSSRSLRFADEIRELTNGEGVDVVLNSLAGEAIAAGLSLLKPYGRFVEIGKRDIYQDSPVGLLALRRNVSLFVLDIDRLCQDRPAVIREVMKIVLAEMAAGRYGSVPTRTFPASQLEQAMRFMAQAKHIGKVVIEMDDPELRVLPSAAELAAFRADGTYFISGGLGGFGLALARHMVERGARSIALMGRSAPSADAELACAALRQRGAQIEIVRGDVSRRDDVTRVLAHVRSTMPPLRGVVHAAMVLDDESIANTTYERFARVLSPKVAGAWNLHLETANDPLDHFVLFSSIAAMLGNPLQSSYCAANSFFDSLAHHRSAHGKAALSIYWGVLAETGYVSRTADVGDYLALQGYLPSTPTQALAALDDLLARDLNSAAASRFDWTRWALASPTAAASPRFRHLVPASGTDAASGHRGGSARASIIAAAPAERRDAAAQFLRERVAKVLGMAPAKIDAERPLTEMGFDSLIAVELVTVLKVELGVDLQVLRLLQGVSVSGLADVVIEQIAPGGAVATSVETPPAPVKPPAPSAAAVVREAPPPVATNGNGNGTHHAPPPPAPTTRRRIDYASLDYSRWDISQRVVRGLLAAGFRTASRMHVEGAENIPRTGGAIVVANHLSFVDAPMMFTVLQRRATLFVHEKYENTAVGRFLDIGHVIYVRPGDDNLAALDEGVTVLRAGGLLGIGPEGRRSLTGGLETAHLGVAYLAARSGAPVIPIATWGQERIAAGWRRLERPHVHVKVGQPMSFPNATAEPRTLREITNTVMTTLAEMLPPEYRGVYS